MIALEKCTSERRQEDRDSLSQKALLSDESSSCLNRRLGEQSPMPLVLVLISMHMYDIYRSYDFMHVFKGNVIV